MLKGVKELQDYTLGATDGLIGKVDEFYFDDETWTVRYLVADTGTWLAGRQVLIPPLALLDLDESEKILRVNLTKEQIEKSPPIDRDKPVSRQYEIQYYQYYGWPAYWGGIGMWHPDPVTDAEGGMPVVPAQAVEEIGDPHLRSTDDITGYDIQAKDDEIGEVDDFVIDTEMWVVRYLLIDTQNWWPGKKVLIAPLWTREISWGERKVFVDLLREAIEQAPEYDQGSTITRDFEARLFKHYNQPAYWGP